MNSCGVSGVPGTLPCLEDQAALPGVSPPSGELLYLLEPQSHSLSSQDVKVYLEALLTYGGSERPWFHRMWVWL